MQFFDNKRGQLAIFIIVGIVIVAGVIGYYLISGNVSSDDIPIEVKPVFSYYESCISDSSRTALSLAGSQGGRIETGEYIPGSEYAPFSNQLNFLGTSVPYWFYVSGNGLVKENIPSKSEIESEMADFISRELESCSFGNFGFENYDVEVDKEKIQTRVTINEDSITVKVITDLSVKKGEVSATKKNFEIQIPSKFGTFYNSAKEVYSLQLKDAFLENYAEDVLRLYAPVDGVEIQCNPKIFKTNDIFNDLKSGLEANIGKIKLDGNYYSLNEKTDKYFVYDGVSSNENVQFLYSRAWPTKIEIFGEGVNSELITAQAVGNQEGLGVMGFCYVPYHYVYDLSFPVMIQFFDNEELFQFPVVVVLDNNLPRNSLLALENTESYDDGFDLCQYPSQDLEVNLYDTNLNKVDARVAFECFNQRCDLGESKNGILKAKIPSCYNGYLKFNSESFEDKKIELSSNSENFKEVILYKKYPVKISVDVGGRILNGNSIVVFKRDDGKTISAVVPDADEIELSEGYYSVSAYVYSNSSINIPTSKKTICENVPQSGFGGLIGLTNEQCFDVEIPATKLESVLVAGGKVDSFLLRSDLETGRLKISTKSFGLPKSIEELQNNFAAFEEETIEVRSE